MINGHKITNGPMERVNRDIKTIFGISFGSLKADKVEQLSIFKDIDSVDKERNLYCALDEIQKKYGKNK